MLLCESLNTWKGLFEWFSPRHCFYHRGQPLTDRKRPVHPVTGRYEPAMEASGTRSVWLHTSKRYGHWKFYSVCFLFSKALQIFPSTWHRPPLNEWKSTKKEPKQNAVDKILDQIEDEVDWNTKQDDENVALGAGEGRIANWCFLLKYVTEPLESWFWFLSWKFSLHRFWYVYKFTCWVNRIEKILFSYRIWEKNKQRLLMHHSSMSESNL